MGFNPDWQTIAEQKGLIREADEPAPALDCSEADFDAAIERLVKRYGWMSHHHFDSRRSSSGWPDRVYCKPPRLLIVELKRQKEKPSIAQLIWITALRACGLDVRVWRPSDWPAIVETLKA